MTGPRRAFDLGPAPRRARMRESTVPMINVVFLLLIFFLMTARIAPPVPLEVTPPRAAGQAGEPRAATLVIAADGTMAFADLRGAPALRAAAQAGADLTLRVDGALPAARLAEAMRTLAAAGVSRAALVVAAP